MRYEKKMKKPFGVKMGWLHHSANALCVQPRSAIFVSEPSASPKLYVDQARQRLMGIPADKTSNAIAGKLARILSAFDKSLSFRITRTTAIASSGRLLSFVRYVAASAK